MNKVSELTGAKLDYWTGEADGRKVEVNGANCFESFDTHVFPNAYQLRYEPSSNWSHGGPIIEQAEIQLVPRANGAQWSAGIDEIVQGGDTPLIAAMRCFVSSRFGLEVPDA